MNTFRNRLLAALLSSALILPAAARPAAADNETVPAADAGNGFLTTDKAGYDRYRREVGRRANYLLNALTAEIRLQEGNSQDAFSHYLAVYRRSKDPATAERIMEILLDGGGADTARQFMREWAADEGTQISPQQRYTRWLLAARNGDLPAVSDGLAEALAQTSPQRLRGAFLHLAELVKNHPKAATPENTALIREAASRHTDMAAAAAADTLFSAHQGQTENARNAFARLLRAADGENPSESNLPLVAELLRQRSPDVWRHFFNETAAEALPPELKYYYASVLLEEGRTEPAYTLTRSAYRSGTLPELPRMQYYLHEALKEDRQALAHYRERNYSQQTDETARQLFTVKPYVLAALQEKDGDAVKIWAGRLEQALLRHAVLARWAMLSDDQTAAAYHFRAVEQHHKETDFYESMAFTVSTDIEILNKLTAAESAAYTAAVSEHYRRLGTQQDETVRKLSAALRQQLLVALSVAHPEHNTAVVEQLKALMHEIPANEQAPIQNAIGYLMSNQPDSDLQEAEALIRKAVSAEPNNPAYLDSLGWVLFKQGQAEAALPYLHRAFAADPDAEIAAHLGEVLWTQGKHDEAKRIWAAVPAADRSEKTYTETLQRLGVTID